MSGVTPPPTFSQLYEAHKPGLAGFRSGETLRARTTSDGGLAVYVHSQFKLSGTGEEALSDRTSKLAKASFAIWNAMAHEYGADTAIAIFRKVERDTGHALNEKVTRGDLKLLQKAAESLDRRSAFVGEMQGRVAVKATLDAIVSPETANKLNEYVLTSPLFKAVMMRPEFCGPEPNKDEFAKVYNQFKDELLAKQIETTISGMKDSGSSEEEMRGMAALIRNEYDEMWSVENDYKLLTNPDLVDHDATAALKAFVNTASGARVSEPLAQEYFRHRLSDKPTSDLSIEENRNQARVLVADWALQGAKAGALGGSLEWINSDWTSGRT